MLFPVVLACAVSTWLTWELCFPESSSPYGSKSELTKGALSEIWKVEVREWPLLLSSYNDRHSGIQGIPAWPCSPLCSLHLRWLLALWLTVIPNPLPDTWKCTHRGSSDREATASRRPLAVPLWHWTGLASWIFLQTRACASEGLISESFSSSLNILPDFYFQQSLTL